MKRTFSILAFGMAMLMVAACGSDNKGAPPPTTPPPRTGPQPTPAPGPNTGNPQGNAGGFNNQPMDWQNFNGTLIGCDQYYCYYYVGGNYDYCGTSFNDCANNW